MNFIRIPIFLALFIIACLTNAQASKTFELNEIADLSKKILQERLDTFDPLKEKSVVGLNKDLGHQKVVFDVQNGQFVTTVLDTEDGISQQVVSFDLPKDKPLRFSRHYTQMGKLVGYLDLEIDPLSKSLKFFGLKSPNCFIFEFGTYNLCFGETEKWFTTLLGKDFEFSCTSCSTPYCGIDISGYCEILSRQAFTFGSAYTTKQTVTIDIYGKPYSALYTYQVNTGSSIKAEGLKIFSPTINLSCGDISVTNLWTLPSSVNAMIADSHYPEESDYVPVNTIRIYSAQLYVDDTWFLVARDIPIKVDYELVRFLAIDHPNHRQMGVNILTPSARQPKVVVKGKTLMAFKSMTITDDNESGCYTSFVPHNYLSVRDPYLEKFYGKNSFLESFETPEAWEKCDKHQCGHGTKETKWQCLRGKLSIEEFRKHLVESKEKPYYTREDLLEASESSSFNDSGWGFGRDSFSSFNRGSNLQAPLPTFYPSNLNLTFQALLSPETPNHIKGIVLGLSLLDHTIKTFNCMKDMQFRLKLNEERSKQTQSGTLPIIGSNSNLNTNLHILTPEEKKEGKKPEKKESVFEPFEKKDLSGKGLFTDLMDKDLPKQNPLIPNVIQNQKSTTSSSILVQEDKKDLSGKGLFKSLMEQDLGKKNSPLSQEKDPSLQKPTLVEKYIIEPIEKHLNTPLENPVFKKVNVKILESIEIYQGHLDTLKEQGFLGKWVASYQEEAILNQSILLPETYGDVYLVGIGMVAGKAMGKSSQVFKGKSANTNTLRGLDLAGENKFSRIRNINNRKPINSEYAGTVYPLEKLPKELRDKYPHSVPFTGTGHPDFSRYATKKVEIRMTGIHTIDKKLANQTAGYAKTPMGYTWHHHQDGKTMMLVPTELHNVVTHTGGVAIVKSKLNEDK